MGYRHRAASPLFRPITCVLAFATRRRGELAERQQRLGAILVTLKKMAEEARAERYRLHSGAM
jgi:hypothetical protein